MIERNFYLDQIIKKEWDGNVKVITGIRRCGKSVLLFEIFKKYLISNGVNEKNIIEIKLDRIEDIKLRNPFLLYKKVNEIINEDEEQYYLFIDEVQMAIKKKEKESGVLVTIYDILNGFRDKKNLDVYVTGSNSKMLSKDIATEFRGRSSQIHVYPLSFKEYYDYVGGDEQQALNTYMLIGGMPGALHEKTIEDKKNYLINLYSEIYVKDIIERNKIQREDILNDILNYLASQISSLTNANKISNALSNSKKEKVSYDIVSKYIECIINSFIVDEAKRYDIKGKSYFNYPNKYYYIDIGLRNARLNFRQIDTGHLMENILYIELIRRGYSVDVGAIPVRCDNDLNFVEIDFVINYLDKKVYMQSAFQIESDAKQVSEIRPLLLTGDFFKKIIIRNDIVSSFYDDKGIYHIRLVDFLLERVKLFD